MSMHYEVYGDAYASNLRMVNIKFKIMFWFTFWFRFVQHFCSSPFFVSKLIFLLNFVNSNVKNDSIVCNMRFSILTCLRWFVDFVCLVFKNLKLIFRMGDRVYAAEKIMKKRVRKVVVYYSLVIISLYWCMYFEFLWIIFVLRAKLNISWNGKDGVKSE